MSNRYCELKDRMPSSYVAFIEARNEGWEGDLGDEFGYVMAWSKEAIGESWDAYEMALNLSEHWFPFGSNGGGEMFCFDLSSGTDRVYWIPYIGMADDEALLRFESFTDVAKAISSATGRESST